MAEYSRASPTAPFGWLEAGVCLCAYPIFFAFTMIISFAVLAISWTRTALGGVGVRTFINLKAKEVHRMMPLGAREKEA